MIEVDEVVRMHVEAADELTGLGTHEFEIIADHETAKVEHDMEIRTQAENVRRVIWSVVLHAQWSDMCCL